MSYFNKYIQLNAEQLDFLARNFKVTQLSKEGEACLMLLTASGLSSVVLDCHSSRVLLRWADPDTVLELKSRGNQFDSNQPEPATLKTVYEAWLKKKKKRKSAQ